jgi:hypothetical protein
MDEIDEQTLEELFRRGRWLTFPEFVRLIEQDHPHDRPGVSKDVLEAYAAAIADDLGTFAPYTLEEVDQLIARHLTRSATWLEAALYEVEPNRISMYPAPWHEKLRGETDPRAYVETMRDEIAAAKGFAAQGKEAPGIPKQQLLDAMVILSGMKRTEATEALGGARRRGEIVIYPFQNPEAEVLLPEETEYRRPTASQGGQSDGEGHERETKIEHAKGEKEPTDQLVSPHLIDIRDDLQHLEDYSNEEVCDSARTVTTMLTELTQHDTSRQEELLDEIENELLHIAIAVKDDDRAAQHVESARRRIGIYRRTLVDGSDNLTVTDSPIRHAHTGQRATVGALQGTRAEVRTKVLNEGDTRNVIAIVTFYDHDHKRLSKARSYRVNIPSRAERTVKIPARVPQTAVLYTVTALDIEDYLIEYQFQ